MLVDLVETRGGKDADRHSQVNLVADVSRYISQRSEYGSSGDDDACRGFAPELLHQSCGVRAGEPHYIRLIIYYKHSYNLAISHHRSCSGRCEGDRMGRMVMYPQRSRFHQWVIRCDSSTFRRRALLPHNFETILRDRHFEGARSRIARQVHRQSS